jgi:UDP-N-acetylmuramoyl-tripeptide--D-alanyl-D-alanine ligase
VAVGGVLLRTSERPIRGGAVDSRRVVDGNAFFALAGERTDGHRFLHDAAARGAAALVVSQPGDEIAVDALGDVAVVHVGDTLQALHRAAAEWRGRHEPLTIGVTGSLAKTSTKEQIAEMLAAHYRVLRNPANENNEIGLPLTLLRMAPDDEVAVVEMGMYEPGDIAQLARLARPTIGVVTAVRGAHLERAGSIDAIERGKRELVEALPRGGTAVLNADDGRVLRMADHAPDGVAVATYGFADDADVRATDLESLGRDGMHFRLITRSATADVTIAALGRHSVHNALAAAAVGFAAGMDMRAIVRGLARPFSVPHRSRLVDAGEWQLLDDTYNAAPDSMVAALDLLASLPGRHVAVLGEMLELGPESDEAHRRVARHAARTADILMGVGEPAQLYAEAAEAAGMDPGSTHTARDRETALRGLLHILRPGDVVLLKASRGVALDLLVDALLEQASAAAA